MRKSGLTAILDSAHLVDTDFAGCPTTRPPVTAPAVAISTLAPTHPEGLGVCYYQAYNGEVGRLYASTQLPGADAVRIADAINAAPAGRNPDLPRDKCWSDGKSHPDVVLLFRTAGGLVSRLWVAIENCTGRGLENGERQAKLSVDLLRLITEPLNSNVTYHEPL
jgi:hypothetical protein